MVNNNKGGKYDILLCGYFLVFYLYQHIYITI